MDIQFLKNQIEILTQACENNNEIDRDSLRFNVTLCDAVSNANMKLSNTLKVYKELLVTMQKQERTSTYLRRLSMLLDNIHLYEPGVMLTRARNMISEYIVDNDSNLLSYNGELETGMKNLISDIQNTLINDMEPEDFLDEADLDILTNSPTGNERWEAVNDRIQEDRETRGSELIKKSEEAAGAAALNLKQELESQGYDVNITGIDDEGFFTEEAINYNAENDWEGKDWKSLAVMVTETREYLKCAIAEAIDLEAEAIAKCPSMAGKFMLSVNPQELSIDMEILDQFTNAVDDRSKQLSMQNEVKNIVIKYQK